MMETSLHRSSKNRMHGTKLDHQFYGRGKLLLSGEYFVLDGAQALAVPVTVGQSLNVKYTPSYSPYLYWKSYDFNGQKWFESKFEFWHFNCLDEEPSEAALFLQKVLRQARKQNAHFLRDEVDVHVETRLGFPLEWGLGSSSTLIYNIAQWAYSSPFELLFNSYGGSGYDIACAQSDGPILYAKKESGPNWSLVNFDPLFKDNIYFVYLGNKKDSQKAIQYYNERRPFPLDLIMNLSSITEDMLHSRSLKEFDSLILAHEEIVSKALKLDRAKDLYFKDYWGEIKSLGAWGGDFVMVTSYRTPQETRDYFSKKGYDVFIPYRELILQSNRMNEENNSYLH